MAAAALSSAASQGTTTHNPSPSLRRYPLTSALTHRERERETVCEIVRKKKPKAGIAPRRREAVVVVTRCFFWLLVGGVVIMLLLLIHSLHRRHDGIRNVFFSFFFLGTTNARKSRTAL